MERCRRRSLLVAVLLTPALSGCSRSAGSAPGPLATPSGPTAAQAAAEHFFAAARVGDRATLDRAVARRDPSFADRARLLADNLGALALDQLWVNLASRPEPLSPARQQLLGADAWRQQATVTWRLTGEPAAAQHTVWLTFVVEQGSVQLAGTLDAPTGVQPQPLWWTGPVTTLRAAGVTVLVGSGQRADAWLRRVRAAVRDVQRSAVGRAGDWDGRVVVEVPASRAAFEAVVGAAPQAYAEIAAVTLAEGPTSSAAVRVVVNPELLGRLAEPGVAVVLAHELVHAATRSADSPAPRWAVEGLADHVAFLAHPAAGRAAEEALLGQVRRQGAPRALPDDDRFDADRSDLALGYAEAWLACRYVADSYSAAALDRLYAALDAGRPLEQASVDALGVSAAELTAGWRRSLVRQAGR